MTLGPRPVPAAQVRELRDSARRQAHTVSAGVGLLVTIIIALLGMAVFVLLDYRMNQAPHRLVKIVLGGVLFAGIAIKPRAGLFLLPILTPFLPWFPKIPIPGINPLNMLLVSVFLTWALYRVLSGQDIFRPARLGWILWAIIAVAILSLVRGAAIPTGYYYNVKESAIALFRSVVTLFVYFITLSMMRGRKDRRNLAWSVVLALLAESVVTVVYGRNGGGARAVGSIGQSNELGSFLAMYTVIAAALMLGVRAWFARLALFVATTAGCVALVFTVSRGAILALTVGILYVGIKSSRGLTVLFVLALLSSPLWAPDYLKDRMTGTQIEVEGTDEAELEGSSQTRIDTWRAIFTLVTDHPLDGVGFAGLEYVLPQTGESLGLEVKDSAHNTYLRFLGEMGIFGLALFLVLLWKCFSLAREGMRAAADRFDRQLAVGFAAATLVMAVSCAFGDRFFSILVAGNYWICCALVNDILLERRETTS